MNKNEFAGFNKDEYVPIMKDESMALLSKLCSENNPRRILEIGTYIGFSASVMLSACDGVIITLEKNADNAKLAQENLASFGDRANVILTDAYDYIVRQDIGKFDLIFLDGPKGQYINYLPYLKNLLNDGGLLIADNVYFHGLVKQEGVIKHKLRTIVVDLRKFLKEITTDLDFDTTIYDIGDGLSVSRKRVIA